MEGLSAKRSAELDEDRDGWLRGHERRVRLLISNPHWQIDWLWGISHQLNPGHHFLFHPWPTGDALSAFMYVPAYGDG